MGAGPGGSWESRTGSAAVGVGTYGPVLAVLGLAVDDGLTGRTVDEQPDRKARLCIGKRLLHGVAGIRVLIVGGDLDHQEATAGVRPLLDVQIQLRPDLKAPARQPHDDCAVVAVGPPAPDWPFTAAVSGP